MRSSRAADHLWQAKVVSAAERESGMGERSQQRPIDGRTQAWAGLTAAGQRSVVERERDDWVVHCDDSKVVRHRLLDVALIEAIRSDVEAHWLGIDPGRYARIVANSILSRGG
jgi:hypothetical protein